MILLFIFTSLYGIDITNTNVYPQDIEALHDFYNATNGPNWFWFKWDQSTLKGGNVCELPRVTCNIQGTRVTEIQLGLNGLNGTLPLSIGQLTALKKLDLAGNEIFGSIPPTITKLQNITELKLNTNKLSGSIPETIGDLNRLVTLKLGQNLLTGTIPYSIGNLTEIIDFELEYNQLSGQIPDSIGKLQKIKTILWQNNNLEGTIPEGLGNKSHLASLTLSHNRLIGRIPDSLGLLPKIKDFLLNDNDLYSDNFGEILSNLLRSNNILSNYKSIQIHNNPKLGGDLSALENMGDVSIYSITAFNCSLYGYIPKTIRFHNVGEFYIWNNRLSCELPQNLLSIDLASKGALYSPFAVLQSNLFWIQSMDTKPVWLSSYDSFSTASSLYYTQTDEIISYIIATFTALCILIFVVTKCKNKFCAKLNNVTLLMDNHYFDGLFVFWDNLQFIQNALNDSKLILISVALLGFYYWNSTYFKCSPLLSQLSLGYYMPSNHYCDLGLVLILFPSVYIFLWWSIINAQTEQLKQNKQYESADEVITLSICNEHWENDDRRSVFKVLGTLLRFCVYLCLFLGSTAFVILSIIFESLPENNSFGINAKIMKVLQYSMAIILTINTAIIVPNVTDCSFMLIKLCCKSLSNTKYVRYIRPFIIIFLRTTSTIIVPICASIFLLNDCGKNWTYFWLECYSSNRSQFDSNIGQQYVYLTADTVCSPISFYNISWNKCIRSFITNWSFVIIQKLFYMILMPILISASKLFRHKIYSKFALFGNNDVNIAFDMEYTMILTKCESMIIFGAISPFVIPLTICSVNSNYFVYRRMVEKHHWRVKPWDNNVLFPIIFLWGAIFISQCFVCCFVFLCIENYRAGFMLIGMLAIIDSIFVAYYMRYKKRLIAN